MELWQVAIGILAVCALGVYLLATVGTNPHEADPADDGVVPEWSRRLMAGEKLPDPWEQLTQDDRDYLKWFFK